ncbi:MAG: AAA family ATPase [Nocardioidaceae bacterium]
MRVHRLEMTAFGPFPDTECIDFDQLNDAGLFLLTGQTGAGKTSILDAICFGLYGAVPGVRNHAKDLRSHHAPADRAPVVELEVTIRRRRFRLRRSPAWQKPSRRAKTGRVDKFARATLEELVDGLWTAHSARVDEIGQLVTSVLGMNREQFCQVVMLPQGQFQTFLRAGAKERHDVLETLFTTGRFAIMERWLTDQRRHTDAACADHLAVITEIAARAQEVALSGSVIEPDATSWAIDGTTSLPSAALGPDVMLAQLTSWWEQLRFRLDGATEREETAAADTKTAQHALDEARETLDRQDRHRQSLDRLRELEALRTVVDEREVTLARARAWLSLLPLLEMRDAAEQDAECDNEQVAALAERITGFVGGHVASTPAEAHLQASHLHERLSSAQRLAAVEARIASGRVDLEGIDAALAEHRPRNAAVRADMGYVCEALTAAAAEMQVSAQVAGRHTALIRDHADALAAIEAAARAVGLHQGVELLRADAAATRASYLDAQELWIDIRRLHLDGMAAELATRLVPAEHCPVCGGVDHPRPAQPTQDHVSATDEMSALVSRNEAEAAALDARSRLAKAESRYAVARAEAGGLSPDAAVAAEATVSQALVDAAEALENRLVVQQLVQTLEGRQRELHDDLVRSQAQIEELDRRRSQTLLRVAEEETALQPMPGDGTGAAESVESLEEQIAVYEELAEALQRLCRSHEHLAQQHAHLLGLMTAHGFADLDDLRHAAITPLEVANGEALNRVHACDVAATRRVAEDPTLAAATALAVPDIAGLQAAFDCATDRYVEMRGAGVELSRQLERLEQLRIGLEAAVRAWDPLTRARDVALEVSTMCAGTSLDNRSRTKLSHYVLGARLQQVVDAANVRLAGISSGRYHLRHCMERGVGDARGGLGLLVLDTYTGQTRDPATLSGGETFYVSLALALGLADLVQNEIGGAELSTLFVDEGFGSLDADTLDEVMDEIDTLRSGGRSVGLVSHLAELRIRVPTQVQVVRGRSGSRVVTR